MLREEAEKLREQNVLMLRTMREGPGRTDDDSAAGGGDVRARSPKEEEKDRRQEYVDEEG